MSRPLEGPVTIKAKEVTWKRATNSTWQTWDKSLWRSQQRKDRNLPQPKEDCPREVLIRMHASRKNQDARWQVEYQQQDEGSENHGLT